VNKRIHYEDNLFILTAMIHLVRDICILEGSPELFLEKSVEDLRFVDKTLGALLDPLIHNPNFIDRNEQLDQFFEIDKELSVIATLLIENRETFSKDAALIPEMTETLRNICVNSANRQRTIEQNYSPDENGSMDHPLSSSEFTELFKPFDPKPREKKSS
jgi:hypothetical protein